MWEISFSSVPIAGKHYELDVVVVVSQCHERVTHTVDKLLDKN